MADVIIACVQCGLKTKTQARPDDPTKPIQSYPEICLDCWLKGWRYEGPFEGDEKWKIYKI